MPGERIAGELLHGANLVEHLIAGRSAQFAGAMVPLHSSGRMLVLTAIDMSSDERRTNRIRHLGKRIIELIAYLGLIVAGKPPVPDVAHDAHYRVGIGTHIRDPETLSDSLALPKACCANTSSMTTTSSLPMRS